MLKDFISAMRNGIYGVMGIKYVNNDNRTIWYIDANNLYDYAFNAKTDIKGL